MTNMGIYKTRFSEVLSDVLERFDISCYKIAQYADLNEAYLSRLRNGSMSNPSPEVIVRIGLALVNYGEKIKMNDIEKLFNATGRTLFPNHRSY